VKALAAWLTVFVTGPIAAHLFYSGAPKFLAVAMVLICFAAALTALAVGRSAWIAFGIGLVLIGVSAPLVGTSGKVAATAGGIAILISLFKFSTARGAR
jgi:hypothetical protein